MLLPLATLHWWGVLAATALFAVLGFVWFTILFARAYRVALGRPGDVPIPVTPLATAGPLVCGFVVVLTTAVLLDDLHVESVGGALGVALLVGVGYLVAQTVNIAINPNFPHPLRYAAISGGYFLVSILASAVLLVALP